MPHRAKLRILYRRLKPMSLSLTNAITELCMLQVRVMESIKVG